MTSRFETQTLYWTIDDYFTRCNEFFNRGEDGVFVSPPDKNMARLETFYRGWDNSNTLVFISIKTEHCVHLDAFHCYRIKYPTSASREELYLAGVVCQKFSGQSTEWSPLVVLMQFEKYIDDEVPTNLVLQFQFVFKKKDEIERNRNMRTDVGAHLMNPAFSDVTIKTSEGDEVPAHKILLVARSDVFRAQFQHDTAVKSTNTVECPFETKVVKDLLTYIYQDKAPNIEVTAFNLLVAAEYYHLDHLKKRCEDVLTKQLNVNNAVELLTLADTHNANHLWKSALKFVTDKKNATEIVKTEEWKSISSELSRRIFEFTLSDK